MAAAPTQGMALCDVHLMYLDGAVEESRIQVGYGNLADSVVAEAVNVLAELIRSSSEALGAPLSGGLLHGPAACANEAAEM